MASAEGAAKIARALALAGAACGAMTGCRGPECQPTRVGEATSHGKTALLNIAEPLESVRQIGLAFGLVAHPPMIAGEMVAIPPTPLPLPPPTSTK